MTRRSPSKMSGCDSSAQLRISPLTIPWNPSEHAPPSFLCSVQTPTSPTLNSLFFSLPSMATITNSLLSKPPPSPSLPKQPTPFFFRPTTTSSSSSSPRLTKPSRPLVARPHRPRGLTLRATAATQKSSPPARDERVQQVHSMEEFDEALRAAQNRLVVVEYTSSHSASSSGMYPFMVELSRQCSDVVFLLVMGDESEATRELCRREKVDKAPHFTFYKSMERVHDEEGIGPDQLVGDVLYYGDNHSAVEQLHSREDVEKLIEGHKADHKLIVLDVGLKHCGPCVKVYPTVIKLSKQMSDSVVFARMNGDENDSCMQFLKDMDVIEVPTFLFIREGEIRGRYVGSGKGELIGEILRYQGVRVTY